MLHPSPRLTIVFALLAAVTACADGHSPPPAPPTAEFLLTTRDSTFWVTSDAKGVHVRGSPILLARFSGRFFEVYASDDDYSYADALLVGQRVYRRDVRSGDSTLVLGDTIVPRIARAYARAHPDEDPLDPGEDTNDDPSTSATAEVDIGDIFGPYMSYQYHADVALENSDAWHTARSGVIDLRSARPVRLSDLFGVSGGQRADALGRSAYESTRASARRAAIDRGAGGRRVLDALERLRFDESSFMLDPRAAQWTSRYANYDGGDPGAFDFKQYRSNTVLRWEYRPGSTIYVVWAQERTSALSGNDARIAPRGLNDLEAAHPMNVFLVKGSYWISY